MISLDKKSTNKSLGLDSVYYDYYGGPITGIYSVRNILSLSKKSCYNNNRKRLQWKFRSIYQGDDYAPLCGINTLSHYYSKHYRQKYDNGLVRTISADRNKLTLDISKPD